MGGASAAGAANAGGASFGGTSSGGTSSGGTSSGGSLQFGGAPAGGAFAGGNSGSGGAPSAGAAASSGGKAAGGAGNSSGGEAARGGSPGTGGAATGGRAATGGSPATGGAPATGGTGGAGTNCALPATFKWTSGGPIASPKSGWVAIKDFTHVFFNDQHIVYMTTHDTGTSWGSAMMTFNDWPNAATATQTTVPSGVAPTLFYFSPKQLWVLAYQWGGQKFNYRTSTNPINVASWSAPKSLYNTALPATGTGPIDQTVICNTTKCYLYYAGDNGHIYKSSLPIANFPGEFPAAQDSGIVGTTQNLFEAVQVYSIKGANKYLMLVEAQGSGRYFRAWTATDLEGPWTLLTDNFAIKSNVTFSSNWTNDISHGDLVRSSPDETFPVDPCNLQLLFQGRDPNFSGDYNLWPYKMGLLTLVR